MTLPLEYLPEVDDEVVAAYRWHEIERAGLGEEFLSAVRASLDDIQENPEANAVLYRKVRACLVRRFRYIIYYRILSDRIKVIAIQHAHRNPRAWRRRA
jgi:toxin ParE1/3/4